MTRVGAAALLLLLLLSLATRRISSVSSSSFIIIVPTRFRCCCFRSVAAAAAAAAARRSIQQSTTTTTAVASATRNFQAYRSIAYSTANMAPSTMPEYEEEGSVTTGRQQSSFTAAEPPQQPQQRKEQQQQQPLLQSWVRHGGTEFHHFAEGEARQIRARLLDWYRAHRRPLPWRGDPPPWRGSTANFAARAASGDREAAAAAAAAKRPKKKQTTVSQYFATKPKNNTKNAQQKQEGEEEDNCGNKIQENNNPETTMIDHQHHHQRQYPVTAYGVWVSEIMLQQTRVEAVVPYWCRWMAAFPTVRALAAATGDEVNAHWSGLGFYRRARLLHAAARRVVDELDGELPRTVAGLEKLPGIGRYTASAIASIACGVSVPVVDGNVCRVLSRLRGIAQNVKAAALKDKHGWELAGQIVRAGPAEEAGDVNQALMELGATYCAPAGSGVDALDPLREFYWSTRLGEQAGEVWKQGGWSAINDMLSEAAAASSSPSPPAKRRQLNKTTTTTTCPVCKANGVEEAMTNMCTEFEAMEPFDATAARKSGHAALPLAPEKTAKKEDVLAVAVISGRPVQGGDAPSWLFVRRPDRGLLAGQWEFPNVCCWSSETAQEGKKKGKRKDMSDQVPLIPSAKRRKALKTFLDALSESQDEQQQHCALSELKLKQLEAPIEHIFSHVRHTMWVEHATAEIFEPDAVLSWVDSQGREVRWMNAQEMRDVGVTSGVKKVLKAVAAQEQKQSLGKSKSVTKTLVKCTTAKRRRK